ncbi:uncharacterized protein LOC117121282 isoform X1 [Anneissia japonica]|uniref:uncharacterized protein LOC117121282 isoform X1 n=1 Tax=Anneissia japonica TaxID=1529436 RepID=UPI0014259D21|nr:uncharacterized protein LOC117121282 isoform X1 [Anneissia japonica]
MACDNAICVWIWEHYTLIIRLWGILTVVATWAIGIDQCSSLKPWVGAYLVFVAVVLTFLEGAFLIGSCLDKCCNLNSCCGKFWSGLKWFDNWKRGVLYILLSVAVYIVPGIAYIAAIMLDILALMYIARSVKGRDPKPVASTRKEEFHDVVAVDESHAKSARGTGSYDDDTDPAGDAGISRYP